MLTGAWGDPWPRLASDGLTQRVPVAPPTLQAWRGWAADVSHGLEHPQCIASHLVLRSDTLGFPLQCEEIV